MSKLWNLDVALVYTTHATLLGRHLAAGGSDLYNSIDKFNLDEEAGKRKVNFALFLVALRLANGKLLGNSVSFVEKPGFNYL